MYIFFYNNNKLNLRLLESRIVLWLFSFINLHYLALYYIYWLDYKTQVNNKQRVAERILSYQNFKNRGIKASMEQWKL